MQVWREKAACAGTASRCFRGTLTRHRTRFQRVWDQIGARKVLFPCLLSPTWIPEHFLTWKQLPHSVWNYVFSSYKLGERSFFFFPCFLGLISSSVQLAERCSVLYEYFILKYEVWEQAIGYWLYFPCSVHIFFFLPFYLRWRTLNATETCLRIIGPWQTKNSTKLGESEYLAEAIYIYIYIYWKLNLKEKSTRNLGCTFSAHRDELPWPTGTMAKENWHHLPFPSVLVTGSVEKILIKQAMSDI